MTSLRLNLLIAILVAILIFLQYRLWFESDGVSDMVHLKKIISTQKAENEKLKKRNDELLFQIERLQKSRDAVEARARNELGMIKKDEMFYQVLDK